MKIAFFEIKDWEREEIKKKIKGHKLLFFDKELTKRNISKISDAEIISVFIYSEVDGNLISKFKNLKAVVTRSTGFDHIDVKECSKRKINVFNVPNYGENTVAEHTFALILALFKNIIKSSDRTRKGNFSFDGLEGFDLMGKTIGIIGLGRIGSFVAQISHGGFNMEILYHDVQKSEEFEMRFSAKYRDLPELLKQADFVTVHVPLLPATHHLIGAKELGMMKTNAILVNTSRGPVVDEHSLVEALKAKKIAGAGLDVFEQEPHLAEGLADLPNVALTPHTASATNEARNSMSKIAAENIVAALEGKQPPNAVKPK